MNRLDFCSRVLSYPPKETDFRVVGEREKGGCDETCAGSRDPALNDG